MTQNAPSPLSIQIASVPDRDQLVAEIWCADDLLAEICFQGNLPQIEIYPRRDNAPWKISLANLTLALRAAEDRLRSM